MDDLIQIATSKGAPNFHRAVNRTQFVRAITDAPNLRDQNARSCWSCAFFQRIEGDYESRRGVCGKFEFDTNEDWICDAWQEKPPEPLQVEMIEPSASAGSDDGNGADDDAEYDVVKTLVAFGSPIKSLGENKIGGYLVRFGSPGQTDLEGEYFDAETDFGFAKGTTIKTPLWFNHRMPMATKSGKQVWIKTRIGEGELSIDDEGVLIEAVLFNRAQYEQVLNQLGWSSGTAQHLVETETAGKATHIKAWPLGLDASLTPMPAEPRNQVVPLKSLKTNVVPKADAQDAGDASSSATNDAGIAQSNPQNTNIQVLGANSAPTEGNQMADNQPTPPADTLEAKFAAFSAKVETFMQVMQDAPAIKNAGYFTQDGGAADKHVKSFGDFLIAVKRNDTKRLKEIYGSVKTLNEGQGESGGYLVPTAYSTELLQVANTASPILGLVRSIPVETDAGEWPVLDQYAAPTAGSGNTAMAAAVTAATRAEAGTYTETEPDFEMLKWRVHSISGITPVSKELNADSPQAIEALLTMLFGIAIGAKKEYYILRGNGAGQPLGILNSAAAIGITPATNNAFAFVDAMTMISRFKKITNNVRWVYHPSIIPDFAGASWVQGDLPIKLTDVGYGEGVTSEHLPQADNSGGVLLADFGAYLLFERGGIEIAFSEHAYFTSGRVAWRFDQRLDGQPWMKNAITLADPQGSFTISPFVYHND